jgi:hypothetical protein
MNDTDDKTRLISLPEASDLYGFDRYYLAKLAQKGVCKHKKQVIVRLQRQKMLKNISAVVQGEHVKVERYSSASLR